MATLLDNPFTVLTPEDMSAEDMESLFVPVFTDFAKIPNVGHVFLHGPRGSGKSMMFRYLQPDCQSRVLKCALRELPFWAVYVPLKNCDLKLTELRRLEGEHASTVLNEHFMVIYIAGKAFSFLAQSTFGPNESQYLEAANALVHETFPALLRNSGYEPSVTPKEKLSSVAGCFAHLNGVCDRLFMEVIGYLRRLAFRRDAIPFSGPLCGYLDFLLPILTQVNSLPFMPGKDKPVFLLVDDADNLNLTQTQVLNSWVSSHTSHLVSLKISTQLQYKTYRTPIGQTIDTPHDYSEINISTIYTASRRGLYPERVEEIVRKRLELFNIPVCPRTFFPENTEQEAAIEAIAEKYRQEWETEGRGATAADDVKRYARPDYMKGLAGSRKSSHTYQYAGFDQLVHISSGIVRYFLEAAAQMYGDVKATDPDSPVLLIPPGIQDRVVRQQAAEFLFDDLEKLKDDRSPDAPGEAVVTKLNNLVNALGRTFRHILLSDRSERRVFSIAFMDEPTTELRDVFRLGQRYGYFHFGTIVNKDGTGRTRLYILSRRLAPLFNLDPTSFAGYLFVTRDLIEEATRTPEKLVRRIADRLKRSRGTEDLFEEGQLKLFD